VARGRVFLRRHLMLSRKYADLLLNGVKKSTIRLGYVIPKYDEVIVHSGGRPIAKAKIIGVEYKKLSELTDEDARLDGFSNVSELLKELERMYGSLHQDDIVTIIKLELIQRFDDLKTDDMYYGINPSDIARIGLRYVRNRLSEEELKILELLGKGYSIREVASTLYGSPLKRLKVRKALRRTLRELIKRKIIKPQDDSNERGGSSKI
jgi:hypothetical protein